MRRTRKVSRRQLIRWGGFAAVWLVLAVSIGLGLFLASERTVDIASHEATISPDFSGQVVVRTGPVLPDLRLDSGQRLGVEIVLGKTDVTSVEILTQRYATIASAPRGQQAVVERAVVDMARDAAVRGAALAVVPLVGWVLVGRSRRRELVRGLLRPQGVAVVLVLVVVATTVTLPWEWRRGEARPVGQWQTLQSFVGDDVVIPDDARGVQVLAPGVTSSTKRLVTSMVSSYERGQAFYAEAATGASDLELRAPEDGETVVVVVSDRHDNVGMDEVARAIGDAGGATAVFDAGDDTSTGETWEAFSLDSVSAAFDDYDRYAVAGNHDHGTFVRDHMSDLGWTYFDGEAVDGPGDSRLLGVDDPRSSGLGDWRDESGLTFAEVEERLTEVTCAADADGERVSTLLVHDANIGSSALDEGCVDLVIGGHTHVESGPIEVEGPDGEVGYTYTVGTTGGAAYAVALGSKLRRSAGVSLITYRDGRPVGIQGVELQTDGRFDVGDWTELTYRQGADDAEDGADDGADDDAVEDAVDDEPSSGGTVGGGD